MNDSNKDDLAFEVYLMVDPEKRRQILQCEEDIKNGDFVSLREIFPESH